MIAAPTLAATAAPTLAATAAPPTAANPRWEDTAVADQVLEPAAAALDRGRPRAVYVDLGEHGGVVTYASCDDACHEEGSWDRTAVASGDVLYEVALAIDPWGAPAGRLPRERQGLVRHLW